ncbi:MAG: virulence protein [Prevotellaceae bacterium]|jgi:virulence-associated protein VapD|nr:virulence protein [Prevotellaceae bacterium]
MFAIAFDMTVEKLKQHYGQPYNNAYFEIGKELRKYNFYNAQGSVYMAKDSSMANLVCALNALKAVAWFRLSVRDIRSFKVEDWSDFTDFMRSGL